MIDQAGNPQMLVSTYFFIDTLTVERLEKIMVL